MKSSPRPPGILAWELPGVQAVLRAPRPKPAFGADWALVVFCTFAAPLAVVLTGLLHPGISPVGIWLAACCLFFAGLALALRLERPPPRRVFDARAAIERTGAMPGERIELRSLYSEPETGLGVPGIAAGMSRAEVLEQLAKLRERGDLSGTEHASVRRALLGE